MSDRFDALALPSRDPYGAQQFGPGYGMPPPEEPPLFWRITRRHWKPLLACAVVSFGVAYLAGKFLAKPLWQAEASLLYQPIAFSEKQRMAYEHPPSLPTLAAWIKEPALLRPIIDEFHLSVSEDDLGDKFIKVDQPAGTESIVVDFKWPERDVTAPALTRLLERSADYVATARKEAILLRIEKLDQQAAVACEDEIRRLNSQLVDLEKKLALNGKLGDEDLDGSMLARRSSLEEEIRKAGYKLREQKGELIYLRGKRDVTETLVRQNAEPRSNLETLDQQVAQLELQIEHGQDSIDKSYEELRTLPIVLTKSKRFEQINKLKFLKDEIKLHELARAHLGKPGGPPARGALEGMDAHEFSIKSPARIGDKPATSSKKALFAVTFLGMMAAAFGLLFVYDRRHPAPESFDRSRVIHVTPPPAGATLNGTDIHRLSAHIQQWVREAQRPIVTPPPEAPMTIGPDGEVENKDAPPATNGHVADADADLLAKRMQQLLGDGKKKK
jgi:hypothetical protein